MDINPKWYRKPSGCRNGKLAKVIQEVLPDLTEKQAKEIVMTIFATVVKGLEKEGSVTVHGFGRFTKHYRKQFTKHVRMANISTSMTFPATNVVRFRACPSLRRSMDD